MLSHNTICVDILVKNTHTHKHKLIKCFFKAINSTKTSCIWVCGYIAHEWDKQKSFFSLNVNKNHQIKLIRTNQNIFSSIKKQFFNHICECNTQMWNFVLITLSSWWYQPKQNNSLAWIINWLWLCFPYKKFAPKKNLVFPQNITLSAN